MIPDIEGEGVPPPKEKAKIAQREGLPVDGIKNYFTAMILSRAAEHGRTTRPGGRILDPACDIKRFPDWRSRCPFDR
jgi:hypothetical protein